MYIYVVQYTNNVFTQRNVFNIQIPVNIVVLYLIVVYSFPKEIVG